MNIVQLFKGSYQLHVTPNTAKAVYVLLRTLGFKGQEYIPEQFDRNSYGWLFIVDGHITGWNSDSARPYPEDRNNCNQWVKPAVYGKVIDLTPVHYEIIIDGRTIELSAESFAALKKSLIKD